MKCKTLYHVNIMWYLLTFKDGKTLHLLKNKRPCMSNFMGQTKHMSYTFCKNSWELLKERKTKQTWNNLSPNYVICFVPGLSEKMHVEELVFCKMLFIGK